MQNLLNIPPVAFILNLHAVIGSFFSSIFSWDFVMDK